MKQFHISDVLSVTTGRLVSSRHMEGIYEILNFLTGDNLYTHQLPRAMRECDPWLRTQFPELFPDNPITAKAIEGMDALMAEGDTRLQRGDKIARWVDGGRHAHPYRPRSGTMRDGWRREGSSCASPVPLGVTTRTHNRQRSCWGGRSWIFALTSIWKQIFA